MRTNIEIDDTLMAKALIVTGAKTKREVVELGLRKLVDMDKQVEALRALWGSAEWEGDLDAMRRDA